MPRKRILILDYSVDESETDAFMRWLPREADVTALYVNAENSIPENILEQNFTHIIHSGSSLSITETAPFTAKAAEVIQKASDRGIAQFGICYGHQLICMALVGKHAVRRSPNGLEAGWGNVIFTEHAQELFGVREEETIWQSHFDEVSALPDGSQLLAGNTHTEIQAYINHRLKIIGMQFHPEFDKQAGDKLFLKNRELLAKHNIDADETLRKHPTIDAGKMFFGYFYDTF